MVAETGSASSSETNMRAIQSLIERVLRNGRIDELSTFWTSDCLNHADPAPEKRGLAAVRSYHETFAKWFLDFENVDIDIVQQIAENDRVVTQIVLQAVHKEERRPISFDSIRIDRMSDGKIAEHWSVADMAGLMRQLAS